MGAPYGELIGDPVGHSKSPLIHKFWLRKLGLDGDYRAFAVKSEHLHEYLFARRQDPLWRGCNVTAPLKGAVMPYLSRADADTERARAANVIIPSPDGSRMGFNTDIEAVAELLPPCLNRAYPNHVATYAQVIGAGGAALAAVTGAVKAGYCDFDFFNRTREKAQAMAALLSLNPQAYGHSLGSLGPLRNPDDGPDDQRYSHVVINATPMGRPGFPDVPIDLRSYYPDTIVFDMAYGDGETRLIRQARELGLRTIDGLQMLVEQAARAFRLFFGAEAPRQHDHELRMLLNR